MFTTDHVRRAIRVYCINELDDDYVPFDNVTLGTFAEKLNKGLLNLNGIESINNIELKVTDYNVDGDYPNLIDFELVVSGTVTAE